jgi:hypothetical protein
VLPSIVIAVLDPLPSATAAKGQVGLVACSYADAMSSVPVGASISGLYEEHGGQSGR